MFMSFDDYFVIGELIMYGYYCVRFLLLSMFLSMVIR